jgi:two-component system, OmpR family, sensor kinase
VTKATSEQDVPSPISAADRALRLEASARTSGALAHEVANYVGAISTWVYMLQEELAEDSEARQDLDFVVETIESANRFINDLRAFAHPASFGPDRTDLNAVVRGLEPKLQECLKEGGRLELRPAAEALWVNGRVAALEPLVLDLVARAAEGLGGSGTVTVETSRRSTEGAPDAAGVRLVVRDDGRALEPDQVRRFFEPFAVGRVRGSGLRLSALYAAVRDNGGVASVETAESETRVAVDLPWWVPRDVDGTDLA